LLLAFFFKNKSVLKPAFFSKKNHASYASAILHQKKKLLLVHFEGKIMGIAHSIQSQVLIRKGAQHYRVGGAAMQGFRSVF
jgi:hypothetical protein